MSFRHLIKSLRKFWARKIFLLFMITRGRSRGRFSRCTTMWRIGLGRRNVSSRVRIEACGRPESSGNYFFQ